MGTRDRSNIYLASIKKIMHTIDIRASDRREGCYTPFSNSACRFSSGRSITIFPKKLIKLNTARCHTIDLTAVRFCVTTGRHSVFFGISKVFHISKDTNNISLHFLKLKYIGNKHRLFAHLR